MQEFDFLTVGGGAAGFFAAINLKQKSPALKIAILEKQSKFLQKVKVSGGGRCNVTNAVTDPVKLASNYPRGEQFLLQPFQIFNTTHTREWFEKRGVKLKAEKDNRVFPTTDSSQTIIDCFLKEAKGVSLLTNSRVESFKQTSTGWKVTLADGQELHTRYLMIASGSDKRIWEEIAGLDLLINEAVPSLFTFNIDDPDLHALQGISFANAKTTIKGSQLTQNGPVLITHWGVSGPAVLKLSAWGAYLLKEKDYKFDIEINWLSDLKTQDIEAALKKTFAENPKKNIRSLAVLGLTQRFWTYICNKSHITEFQKGAEAGKKQIAALIKNLTHSEFNIIGKSTFKEEFVTAGGIVLSQINPSSFASLKYPNLYFGGEILDIDAITGGFNFQAAWTAGWLVSEDVAKII